MSRIKLITLLVSVIVILIGFGGYLIINKNSFESTQGTADIGGDFTLVNHDNETVSQASYKGMKTLMFFGFTNCPDVCPAELSNIATALEKIDAKRLENFKVIFVSLDPEYDKPAVIKAYIKAFNDDFIGLTGNAEQIKQIADAYRVYYKKVEHKNSATGYMIEHRAYSYLMDENNKYLAHISADSGVDTIVKMLRELL